MDLGASGAEVLFHALPLIDYLQGLVDQGKSRGSIKAAKSAASFDEYVAGIEERDRVTRSVIFQSLYAEILASASPGAAPGPAPRPLITLLGAMENSISDSSLPPFIRVMGWWKCLQVWAALRHYDHRGIRPRDLVLSAGSLRGELWRSKTTGCDKVVKSRPILIVPMACVYDPGWLLVGWQLLLDLCASPQNLLLPTPTCGGTSTALAPLTHRDATTLSLYLMSHLRRPDHKGFPLLHACAALGYWRQHSGRSFLTTAASCLGFSTTDLDLLGGWRAQGGAAYVRRVRGKVSQIQSLVRGVIARGEAHCALEEVEAIQDLSTWLRDRGVSEAEIDEQVEALGVHPASDSQAALPLDKLREASTLQEHSFDKELTDFEAEPKANSRGVQLLGGSVGAPEEEELVPAGEVLCGGLPSRMVPDSILPYPSDGGALPRRFCETCCGPGLNSLGGPLRHFLWISALFVSLRFLES